MVTGRVHCIRVMGHGGFCHSSEETISIPLNGFNAQTVARPHAKQVIALFVAAIFPFQHCRLLNQYSFHSSLPPLAYTRLRDSANLIPRQRNAGIYIIPNIVAMRLRLFIFGQTLSAPRE